jgi:RNA polymerase sigma-70 factor (ECF subfamily)
VLRLLHMLMVAVERAVLALSELAALPLGAAERLAWERDMIAAHANGDRSAFEALYRAYASVLYSRVLLPLLKNATLAEDALADTFTRAHEKITSFRSTDRSLYFWLSRIARNCGLDLQRRAAMQQRATPTLRTHIEQLVISEPDPETALSLHSEAAYVGNRVSQVLTAIHPRYRRAIELRFFEEKTRDDCAVSLEVKIATFDVLLLRALRAFRQQWEKQPT